MSEPVISIIVAVFNGDRTINKCVQSLLSVDYPKYEIIIVDDGSTDRTKQILFGYKDKIRIIQLEHQGPSKCRNKAVLEAKGDFVAFTDSDCVVDKDWIRQLMRGFSSDDIVSVGGSQFSPEDDSYFGKRVQDCFALSGFIGGYFKKRGLANIVEVDHNPSCNVIYRKDIFLKEGGFDETLWPGEDVDLDYRLKRKGYKLFYNPLAKVYHYRPNSFRKLSSMMFRYGFVQGIIIKRYRLVRKIILFPLLLVVMIAIGLKWPFSLLLLLLGAFLILALRLSNFINSLCVFIIGVTALLSWLAGFTGGLISKGR